MEKRENKKISQTGLGEKRQADRRRRGENSKLGKKGKGSPQSRPTEFEVILGTRVGDTAVLTQSETQEGERCTQGAAVLITHSTITD